MEKKYIQFLFLLLIFSCKKPLQSTNYYETNNATGTTQKRSALAFGESKENYPIDVFFKPNLPTYEVESIEEVKLSGEDFNTSKEKIVGNRMVQRGKSYDEKKLLITALIEKAQDLGASCLYDVNYQYYTTSKVSGFVISGIAGKYSLKNIKN